MQSFLNHIQDNSFCMDLLKIYFTNSYQIK